MSRLVFLRDLDSGNKQESPSWYFLDAVYNHRGSGQKFTYNIKKTYPYAIYIHWDKLDLSEKRVAVREFIEKSCTDVCIADYFDLSYVIRSKNTYSTIEVRHGYWVFYFRTESDAEYFRLSFNDIASLEYLEKHPRYLVYEKSDN
jgi:hypothetical protein